MNHRKVESMSHSRAVLLFDITGSRISSRATKLQFKVAFAVQPQNPFVEPRFEVNHFPNGPRQLSHL
jgi:hypothetical protein